MELIFSYKPGNSILHRLDPRLKLVLLILLSLVTATAELPVTATGTLLIAIALILSVRLSIASRLLLSAIKFILVVAMIVIISQLLQGMREWNPLLLVHFLTQLLFWILLGFIFTATTSLTELRAAVYRIARRIPRFPAAGFALMVSITLASLPLFFDARRRNSEALAARSRVAWYRPVRRIRVEVIPLLTRLMRRSQLLSESLLSRGFHEQRSFDLPPFKPGQVAAVLLISASLIFLVYLPALLGYTQ